MNIKGTSKKVISRNIRELLQGPRQKRQSVALGLSARKRQGGDIIPPQPEGGLGE